MGSAGFGSVSSSTTAMLAGGFVSAHDGVGFCIGSAGFGSLVPGDIDAPDSIGSDVAGSTAGVAALSGREVPASSGSSGSVWGSNDGVTSGSSSSSAPGAMAAPGLALASNGLVSRGTTGAV
jgi:hypothetical protein